MFCIDIKNKNCDKYKDDVWAESIYNLVKCFADDVFAIIQIKLYE